MSCFGCFPEVNRSLCSQLVFHDFGRGRFSHLFKLDIQGLKVTNHNVQVLFKTRAILQQNVLFILLFSAALPIQMIKALGERERLHPSVQHPDERFLWGHHSSVAAQDEYDETWEKCKTKSPMPPQQNYMDGVGLCRKFVPGLLPPPLLYWRGCGRKAVRL